MRGEAGNGERAGLESRAKLGVEYFGDWRLDLVLNGDVEAGAGLVLRDQETAKVVRQFIAEAEQFGAVDAVGDAPAQQHHVAKPRHRWRTLRCQRCQPRFDLGQMAGRQMVEQRNMRVEVVALGREMRAAQAVRPRLIGLAHFGGEDDRK